MPNVKNIWKATIEQKHNKMTNKKASKAKSIKLQISLMIDNYAKHGRYY